MYLKDTFKTQMQTFKELVVVLGLIFFVFLVKYRRKEKWAQLNALSPITGIHI